MCSYNLNKIINEMICGVVVRKLFDLHRSKGPKPCCEKIYHEKEDFQGKIVFKKYDTASVGG